jgi:hypothetical protein
LEQTAKKNNSPAGIPFRSSALNSYFDALSGKLPEGTLPSNVSRWYFRKMGCGTRA